MDIQREVLALLDEVLSLSGRTSSFTAETQLLGALPELDSMAVASILTMMEDRFGIATQDDDISGENFATVASLTNFVVDRLN